ncbi:unnamed protein product [Phytomonas sp. Hart1]|nr:unnamed protein product [Phytomonas sp. Hart1]|eukprot:CCW66989.1 unnamed protein product [Phytomonas sp. isolate Hart1]
MVNEHCSLDLADVHTLCEAAVDYVLQNVNTVGYIIKGIEEITLKAFPRERIKCLKADPVSLLGSENTSSLTNLPTVDFSSISAGYMWQRTRPDCEKGDIVLIEDYLTLMNQAPQNHTPSALEESKPDTKIKDTTNLSSSVDLTTELEKYHKNVLNFVERNLRHELIHAFDDVRGHIDSADCFHQACSEVRAARLSGDCFVGEELKRGRFDYFEGGLKCVQRRATMALETNPICRGFSKRAVDTVFQRCYSDYEPFAAPVYTMGSYGERRFETGVLKQK